MTEDAQQQTGEGSKHGNLMQESYKTCLVYHEKAFWLFLRRLPNRPSAPKYRQTLTCDRP